MFHSSLQHAPFQYASGVQAQVIGKPSKTFFTSALKYLEVSAEHVSHLLYCYAPGARYLIILAQALMVGDDIVGDVEGAKQCGLFGVLVRTGKFR